jgi:hypothetical protein
LCYLLSVHGFELCRLQDVVHSDKCIYLVFEYLDLDLKKHMDSSQDFNNHRTVKVQSMLSALLLSIQLTVAAFSL